jgi:hypothetical protein
MGFWRSLTILSALAVSASAAGQSRSGYEGDLIVEPDEPPPPRTWHQATEEERQVAEANLARFNSPTLARFGSDEQFRRYLGAVLAAQRARYGWYAASGHIQFAQAAGDSSVQSDAIEPICPPEDPQCLARPQAEEDVGNISVTGSRMAAPSNPSITNNQMRGVEEGDIVKQIGRFLLVLQDGRIFVADTRGGADGRRLVLASRTNVYRDPDDEMWYDEMLVFGDRILVTGYSYAHDATELSVFRLDDSGRLERQGVFYISSNDYYSSSNYATRLIGDRLVIYTPFEVSDMAEQTFRWPVVRRWTQADDEDWEKARGRPLFEAAQIYRPVRSDEDPTVHTVSVCPLASAGADRDLECRTTAFIGPNSAQWYVTGDDAFLWTTSRDYYSYDSQACDAPHDPYEELQPALVYRVPVEGAAIGVAGARGVPPDQFSLQSGEGRFRALLKARPRDCEDEPDPGSRLSYLDLPLAAFAGTLREMPRERYVPLPGVGSHYIANRFTERYLVYGGLGRSRRGYSQRSSQPGYVLPVEDPAAVGPRPVRHTLIRAERAGDDFVLTGYRDESGLVVTVIGLEGRPRIASQALLEGRYESEGRSHALNSLIEPDGSGLMGLPTIARETWSSRAAWRSTASDLSFLRLDRGRQLQPVGELSRRFDYGSRDDDDEDGIPGYECEVSCIDWYGNSRPIFTDGRIFALTGTELIEGRLGSRRIAEVQRLNIALPAAGGR